MTRFVNTSLLILLAVLGLSGVFMLYGAWLPWIFDLHRISGFSLVALLPWKGVIIVRSLRRGFGKRFDRRSVILASLVLLLAVLLVIALALLWMARLGPYSLLHQTLIAWHWIIGLLLIPLALFHLWRRWPNPKMQDVLSRREALKALGLAGAGFLAAGLAERLAESRAAPSRPRRFTGSQGAGFFSGNDFPVTGESAPALDVRRWRLALTGALRSPLELGYEALLERAGQRKNETLDCTNGWYSVQEWQGVALIDLLQEAGMMAEGAGVRLFSATGYHHSYPFEEARTILLATHVSGEPLAPRHGFPLRAVVPGRRGWFWVKWLVKIEALDSPLEVAAGVLASPGEVLRQWR